MDVTEEMLLKQKINTLEDHIMTLQKELEHAYIILDVQADRLRGFDKFSEGRSNE